MSSTAPGQLLVERGSGDDLDAVMAVMCSAFDPSFGEAWTRAQCAGILPMAGVTLMVARKDGDAVGFSLARRILDEAELLLIAVRPDHARSRVGSALLQRFVADQKMAGARHLHLEVRDGNPAVRLYLDNGFAVAGRRSSYYRGTNGDRFDALTMTLEV
ncbi:ribosomal-protein-alanine N-acetyltransferase [Sphingomonas kaistensis]|uniref:Ribosomal-protein-alanine N-acetyltransferase n=1 Tax=Sphingomonas kaistensis TaxID=298708 RepID=A0A7X5Y667_9SPHN|nr:GNAT family N-acetyltransferase [Sphingomonas kaistensis]NJC05862.1 ribosomal-protein-alanine N-acetyltransferase [Sphingomonas kaistensis]